MPEDLSQSGQLQVDQLLQILSTVDPSSEFFRRSAEMLETHLVPYLPAWPAATPRGHHRSGGTPLLTIGMATFDDYDGVFFSIQAIRMFHPEVLQAEGDRPIAEILRRRRVGHAWQFSLPDQQSCDLHWRPVVRCHSPAVTAFFWESAETASVYGQTARIPSVTALLFHVCIHGLQWSWTGHTRWVADGLTLLHSGRTVDWPALIRLGSQANMTVRLRDALAYLASRFKAPVPQAVLAELAAISAPRWERREAVILLKECPLGFRDSLTWHLSHFRRIRPFDEEWSKAPFWSAFVSYLRMFLEAEDWNTFTRKSWVQLRERSAFRERRRP
jgi:Uncharacterised nucleotidyltransferase